MIRRLRDHLPLALCAGGFFACAAPIEVEEFPACEVVSVPRLGPPPSLTLRRFDPGGRLTDQRCDGCDQRGMDGVPDVVRTVRREGPATERTTEVTRTDEGPYFTDSVVRTDARGCAFERRFWLGTPQDWALDLTTCDAAGRPVTEVEDLNLGVHPGRARTLARDRWGRVRDEHFDRDEDGWPEERTRWRYEGMSVPVRRDWYLGGNLTARSTFLRAADGHLLAELYDYRVDGVTDVTVLYGYGCPAG